MMTNEARYNYIVSKMNSAFEQSIPEKDRKAIEGDTYDFGFFGFGINDSYYYYRSYLKDRAEIKNAKKEVLFIDSNGELQSKIEVSYPALLGFVLLYSHVYRYLLGHQLDLAPLELEIDDTINRTYKTYIADTRVSTANAIDLGRWIERSIRAKESTEAIRAGKEDDPSRDAYIKGLISALESSMTNMLDLMKGGANERATRIRTKFAEAIAKKYGAELLNRNILDPVLIFKSPDGKTFNVKYDEYINSTQNFVTNLTSSLGEYAGTTLGFMFGGVAGGVVGSFVGAIADTALKAYRYDFELDTDDYVGKGLEAAILTGALHFAGKAIQTFMKIPNVKKGIDTIVKEVSDSRAGEIVRKVSAKLFGNGATPDPKALVSSNVASDVTTSALKSESTGVISTNMKRLRSKSAKDKSFAKNYKSKRQNINAKDRRTNKTGRERLKPAEEARSAKPPTSAKPSGAPKGSPKAPKGGGSKIMNKAKGRFKGATFKAIASIALKAHINKSNTKEKGTPTYQFAPVMYENDYYYVKLTDTNDAPNVIKRENLKPLAYRGQISGIPNIYIKTKGNPYVELKARLSKDKLQKGDEVSPNLAKDKLQKGDEVQEPLKPKTENVSDTTTKPSKVEPSTPQPLDNTEVINSVKVIEQTSGEEINNPAPKMNEVPMNSAKKIKQIN